MESVSQNSRRKPRPWTAQEQTTLEVAAACGVPIKEIAAALDRCTQMLRKHVGPGSTAERRQAMAEYQKAYHAANRDRKSVTHKAWYLANKKRKNAANKAWKIANRKRVIAKNQAWGKANRERRSAMAKARYLANREHMSAISKAWYEANRERKNATATAWKAANRERWREVLRRRRTRLKAGRSLCEITFSDRQKRFLLWDSSCAYCGTVGKMTVDHVQPVKHGGLDESLNIVPACRRCNSSKNASPVESWYRRQPFFTEARWRKIQRHCPAAVAGQLPLALPA
jgi:5-methylcytosine-specific restriction endonuclease McrA